ncbi:MAG: hypothetical protein EKK40_06905 [Bradyrhizobiaceae bacterium]|nr:MAG: hypothetical protein EKK40_06905 [Bradyrhizobiaceae bacterium]
MTADSELTKVFDMRANANENYPSRLITNINTQTVETFVRFNCQRYAEFGVNLGSTALEIARHLGGKGEIYLFDFQYNVDYVDELLRANGFTNVRKFGSSTKLLDSYNWPLSNLIKDNSEPLFDYCFIDGAHVWNIDALTFFLADRLLAVGGLVDFDDYDWSLGTSPTLAPNIFPRTAEFYTDEQIADQQVKRVVDLLVKTSPRYEVVIENKIYRKIAHDGAGQKTLRPSLWQRLLGR